MTRVALDLLGGDPRPASVVDGALLALDEQPRRRARARRPVDVAQRCSTAARRRLRRAVAGGGQRRSSAWTRTRPAPCAPSATPPSASPPASCATARPTRSSPSARTGAALAAAVFTLGRLRGVARPPLAAVVPAAAGPLVFLDVGATTEATPELLAPVRPGRRGLRDASGSAWPDPRVGLLTIGEEAGKGDALRKAGARPARRPADRLRRQRRGRATCRTAARRRRRHRRLHRQRARQGARGRGRHAHRAVRAPPGQTPERRRGVPRAADLRRRGAPAACRPTRSAARCCSA